MNQSNQKISYKYNIFKLLAVSILLVSVTFCWFIFTKDTSIDSINLEVVGTLSVTISDNSKEEWGNKLNINNVNNVSVTEYSGNGEKLYLPIAEKYQVTGYVVDENSLNVDSEGRNYIEVVTYVKTDGPICLYLSPESKITPKNDTKLQDNIAGAVRVAVLVDDYKPFIWVPNTTYEYNSETNTVNKNGTPESSFTYAYKDSSDEYISSEDVIVIDNSALNPVGVSDDKRFVWGDLNEIDDYVNAVEPIFKTAKDLTTETEVRMVIRVWIEGNDREAVKSLVGGKFNLNLSFLAVDNK